MSGPHLTVVLPAIPADGSRVEISDKTWSGLEAFRERWPGVVSVVGRPVSHDVSGNLGTRMYDVSDLPWDLRLQEPTDAVATLRPDVVQVPLHLRHRDLIPRVPSVVVVENSSRERLRYAMSTASRNQMPRMILGAVRQGWSLRAMARSAAGIACNGWASWAAYRAAGMDHAVAPLLYFDTRLGLGRVEQASKRLALPTPSPVPLRLAFSGRMHPAKGAHHAVATSTELDRRGVVHSLTMLGDGPDLSQLQGVAGPSVTWRGELAFEPDWVGLVSTSMDLMVLPHTQGDPSGTYLEAAGLGVPVVGFDNAALRGHELKAGFAVTTGRWTPGSLADVVQQLANDDARRRHLRGAGIDFMRRHAFEPTFDARVDHLLRVAELSA